MPRQHHHRTLQDHLDIFIQSWKDRLYFLTHNRGLSCVVVLIILVILATVALEQHIENEQIHNAGQPDHSDVTIETLVAPK